MTSWPKARPHTKLARPRKRRPIGPSDGPKIRCIVDQDVNLIASHFGVEGMDAWRVCYAIGAHFHADGVAKVLTLARDRTKGAKVIHLAAIREALVLMPHFSAALDDGPLPKRAQRRTTLGPA